MRRKLIRWLCSPKEFRVIWEVYQARRAIREARGDLRALQRDLDAYTTDVLISGPCLGALTMGSRVNRLGYVENLRVARVQLNTALRKGIESDIERWKLSLAW